MGVQSRAVKHLLPAVYTKTCPWKEHSFETSNPKALYCSPAHSRQMQRQRNRERHRASREIEVEAKPGASYKLHFREVVKVPEAVVRMAPRPIESSVKAPYRVVAGFSLMPGVYNLPELSAASCAHGVEAGDYCVNCDFA